MSIVLKQNNYRQDMDDRSVNQIINMCAQAWVEAYGSAPWTQCVTDTIRQMRLEGFEHRATANYVEFEFDGRTYMLANEEDYERRCEYAIEELLDQIESDINYEIGQYYWAPYFTLDRERLINDLAYNNEFDAYIAPYDGCVEEINVNSIDDEGVVYRTGDTLYLWREA